MTQYVIECRDTFRTKGFPNELIFGDINDQTIPSKYYNLLNDNDNDGNKNPPTPVHDVLLYKEGVEYSVVPNDKYINDKIKTDDYDNLASDIEPPQNKIMEIEGVESGNDLSKIELLDSETKGVES